MNGKTLNVRWRVGARQALYRESGDWYHQLTRFPGALFDIGGYIVFRTRAEYDGCAELRRAKDIHVPGGISNIPGYVRVVAEFGANEGDDTTRMEGTPRDVVLTRYERDPIARRLCLLHWGNECRVCKFDFRAVYGEAGADIIHVHHHVPLATHSKKHDVDPVRDLVPVCANCHAVIHRRSPPYSVIEMRRMFRRGVAAR